MCPSPGGGNNFWPSSYSAKTKLLYVPALTYCTNLTRDSSLSVKKDDRMPGGTTKTAERAETDVSAIDPVTGEVKFKAHIPYPDNSGALTTAGGLVITGFTDGTLMAFDDTSMQQLWKFNVGTGFNAPPMTFEVGGKQYVAILSGLSRIALNKHVNFPEFKEQRNQTMLWVFAL